MVRNALISFAAVLLVGSPSLHAAAQPSSKSKAPTPAASTSGRLASTARRPYLGAIVMEAATGRVLFEEGASAKGYPASTLKLMDLLLILERIEARQLTWTDPVTVSARAAKTGGSQVYLKEKEVFTVDEMLFALMIQSANDAAVALAEKVAGTSEGFVALMNQRAKELGMKDTVFNSVHGLPPGAGQRPDVTTARDFAILCRELLKHPHALRYTATRERPFRPGVPNSTIIMRSHNPLLGKVAGCDGLKTGYIAAAGYSIAATAERNGHRVIVVVLDSADRRERDAKAAELIEKGFLALPGATAPVPVTAPLPIPARK
jgi:D-alanyl-D-alanine carboxypeptidase (penicillin-binding protein 5/6)